MQAIARKSYDNQEALGKRICYLSCVVRAGENGEKFHLFCGRTDGGKHVLKVRIILNNNFGQKRMR